MAAAAASSTLSLLNLRKPRSCRVPPHRPSSAAFLRAAATLRGAESATSLAATWRKVQGADNWTGLVEPLSPLLRDVLIRYGELAMACYKAFDLDPASPTHLRCKYRKPRLMAEVGLGAAGYEVTKYVYATPPDIGLPLRRRRARWIGYVAVSSDAARRRLGRRDVLVAFRGTATGAEWAANLMSSLAPANLDPACGPPRRGVEVESGFLGLYTAAGAGWGSCREQLLGEVRRLVRVHEGEEMSITLAGHSMGSALAVLLGYDLAEIGVAGAADQVPVTVYSFGGPRVGNGVFKERCEELGVKVLRVANVHDPVTKLPGLFINERRPWPRWSSSCYAHVGVELAVECLGTRNPMRVHDLETYLGLLRSPKMVEAEEEKSREEQELQAWPWQVRNLVQSLGLSNLNI